MNDTPIQEITRPNGKPYRPRKITACEVSDEDEIVCGAIVFGTHDPGCAQPLADAVARSEAGSGFVAVDPQAVWWRDGFACGRRRWIHDEVRGRAGVWFREIVETAS